LKFSYKIFESDDRLLAISDSSIIGKKFKEGELKAGDDASEVGWFSLEDLKEIEVNKTTKELVLKYLGSDSK